MLPKIATGVYWKPVFNRLEGRFELLVVNAQQQSKPRHASWIIRKVDDSRKRMMRPTDGIDERFDLPVRFPCLLP